METLQSVFSRDIDPAWRKLLVANEPSERFVLCLAPLVAYIHDAIVDAVSIEDCFVSDGAFKQYIAQHLTQKLNPIIGRTCVYELHALKHDGALQGDTPQARFDYFIELIAKKENILLILQKYPSLASYLSQIAEQEIRYFELLLSRFSSDRELLTEHLHVSKENYLIQHIQSSGDQHRHGQRVAILTLAQGMKLIYKPRSLAIDGAYNHLVHWVNQYLPSPLLTIAHVERGDYGWCEFIEAKSVNSEEDVHHYYERFGSLLAIHYLLTGTDIHAENVIAHGEQPVIVDLECLLSPIFKVESEEAILPFTVMNTFMLPNRRYVEEDNEGIDQSGVSGKGGAKSPYTGVAWENSGSDEMQAVRLQQTTPHNHNIVKLGEALVNPLDYESDFQAGFNRVCELFLQHKDVLLSDDSPLTVFKGCEVRVVLRNTSEYSKLLIESYHPELFYYQNKRQTHFNWLRENKTHQISDEAFCAKEIEELQTGNIPAFYCASDDETILAFDGTILAVKIDKSGYDNMLNHIQDSINNKGFAEQTKLIKDSFAEARNN